MQTAEKIEVTPPTKHELIVAAARKLFSSEGFGAVSMDAIAAEAGVSKRTVYSHFDNKESLFAVIMGDMCREFGGPDLDSAPPIDAPEAILKAVGRMILDRILSPHGCTVLRTVLAESAQFPELGEVFWNEGPGRVKRYVSDYLAELDRREELLIPDPDLAALQFIGIVTGPYLLPRLLGVAAAPSEAELDKALDHAVSTFLDGLRPR